MFIHRYHQRLCKDLHSLESKIATMGPEDRTEFGDSREALIEELKILQQISENLIKMCERLGRAVSEGPPVTKVEGRTNIGSRT
jgi:hypothetical protein